jgi:hypothetical protein
MLWREIGIGLGFGLIGLAMMALAIGAAGVAPPAAHSDGAAPVVVHATANHRLEIYQDPAELLGAALPVP